MIDLACLDRASPPAADMMLSDGVFDFAVVVVVAALALAAFAAPFVRRAYRQRVTRLMRLDQVVARPQGWWTPPAGAATRQAAAGGPAAPDASGLAALARQRQHRITRATAVAWAAFSLAAVPVAGWVGAGTGVAGRLTFATAAALLALGPALANLPPRWTRRALAIGFGSCVLGLLLIGNLDTGNGAPAGRGKADDDLPAWQIALFALVAGGGYVVIFHRTLRGQVLPVFVVLAVSMLAVFFPASLLERHVGSCLAEYTSSLAVSPSDAGMGVVLLALVLTGLWLGLGALGGLVRLIERGWLSELSMATAVGLMPIALWLVYNAIPDVVDGRSAWLAWLPLAWVSVPLGAYAVAIGRSLSTAPGPQLLVLRVFAQDSHKHNLLDEVQSRWRYVGAVHQIGGPDMVAMNVDPYEVAMFLGCRLHELFLPEATSPAQLQARLNSAPDREGRYSINEVFCFNTAWRTTVDQLMHLSDAIVLDLRGLTAQREGTGYEIRRLARDSLLPRVVAVGDDATDWTHVDTLLRSEGRDLQQLNRLNITADAQGDELFARLLKAASTRRAAPAA